MDVRHGDAAKIIKVFVEGVRKIMLLWEDMSYYRIEIELLSTEKELDVCD
jgi:hypothetical protein